MDRLADAQRLQTPANFDSRCSYEASFIVPKEKRSSPKWNSGNENVFPLLHLFYSLKIRFICRKCLRLDDSIFFCVYDFQEIGRQKLADMPRDGSIIRIRPRCALTSRPRGVVHRWRLSRIVWRDLADNNKLSGVQRAMWWGIRARNKAN